MCRKFEDIQPAVKLGIDTSDGQTDPMTPTKVESKKKESWEINMASLSTPERPCEALDGAGEVSGLRANTSQVSEAWNWITGELLLLIHITHT